VVIAELNQFARGWLPCYGEGLSQHLKRALNRWIIRWLKAWRLKQWHKPALALLARGPSHRSTPGPGTRRASRLTRTRLAIGRDR
jgi:hypothetical protein